MEQIKISLSHDTKDSVVEKIYRTLDYLVHQNIFRLLAEFRYFSSKIPKFGLHILIYYIRICETQQRNLVIYTRA